MYGVCILWCVKRRVLVKSTPKEGLNGEFMPSWSKRSLCDVIHDELFSVMGEVQADNSTFTWR